MLEDRIKVGGLKPADNYREVEPITPYPRINPQQQQREKRAPLEPDKRPKTNKQPRRRFTAMRELIELLKMKTKIARVDFNTVNKELHDQGLMIAEDQLITQLLHLKIPLKSIEELIQQLQLKSTGLVPTTGRILSPASNLFPSHVDGLSEYLMRFDDLLVNIGEHGSGLVDEINNHGRCIFDHNRLRLDFRPLNSSETAAAEPLRLSISIQIGAIEIDENGRRAIIYERPDQTYGLYSDKSISLSI